MTNNIISPLWPSAAEDLAQLVQSNRPSKTKQSPAQRRKALYEDLVSALTNGEHESVRELVESNPDVNLDEAGWEYLASTALKYFDFNSVRLLHEKGLPLNASFMHRTLQKDFDPRVFDYFCDSKHLYAASEEYFNTALLIMYQQALCGYAIAQERLRAQYRHVREKVEGVFSDWATEARKKMDLTDYNWREAVERLPFRYPTKLGPSDVRFFNSLTEKELQHILTKVGEKDKITAGELESLNRFICADPKRLEFWTRQENERHTARLTYKQQWVGWGLEGQYDWANTQLPKMLEDTKNTLSPDLKPNFVMVLNYRYDHQNMSYSYFEQSEEYSYYKNHQRYEKIPCFCGPAPICHEQLDPLLGWDLLDAVMLTPDQTCFELKLERHPDKKNLKNLFESVTVPTPSLLHNMISTGAPAIGALLKNPHGAQVVNTLLTEDKALLILWCKKSALSAFADLVAALPQWKDWTDAHGNNLGHYIMASRVEQYYEISPNTLSTLSKINPQWLLAENNQGLTVSQIAKTGNFKEDALNWLEKHALSQSVKSELKTSGIKPKAQKRRM